MESDRIIARKAMAWDLCRILDSSEKETFTREEVEELIKDYIHTTAAAEE